MWRGWQGRRVLFGGRSVAAPALLAFVLGVVVAAANAASSPPLGSERARLFLTRTGFAPPEAEVVRWAPLTQAQAVDRLLAETVASATLAPPGWVDEPIVPPRELRAMSDDARKLERQKQARRGVELRGWWLREMIATPSPLSERLTLFWHNHFVSSQQKVRYAQLMYRQNVLLRTHAAGNFGTLLHAIARDPAMMVYLDMASNRRDAPNENFAREVMELFTLGEGHYSEDDVKQAARAFSGWSLDPERGAFMFRPRLHDGGEKTVLGRRGDFDGDAVLDLLLAQPATAEFIVRKLWVEFVSPQPDARANAIAQRFRAAGYDIKAVLRELFMQPELVQRDESNALVKSPAELAVGLVRQSGAAVPYPGALAIRVAAMGQNLFAPPNVRGWPGGEAWINTQTLLTRKQFLAAAITTAPSAPADMAAGVERTLATADDDAEPDPVRKLAKQMRALAGLPAVRIDSTAWLKTAGAFPERVIGVDGVAGLAQQLLVLPPVSAAAPEALGADALRALVLDPVYQLK